jgi:hypothetical protein
MPKARYNRLCYRKRGDPVLPEPKTRRRGKWYRRRARIPSTSTSDEDATYQAPVFPPMFLGFSPHAPREYEVLAGGDQGVHDNEEGMRSAEENEGVDRNSDFFLPEENEDVDDVNPDLFAPQAPSGPEDLAGGDDENDFLNDPWEEADEELTEDEEWTLGEEVRPNELFIEAFVRMCSNDQFIRKNSASRLFELIKRYKDTLFAEEFKSFQQHRRDLLGKRCPPMWMDVVYQVIATGEVKDKLRIKEFPRKELVKSKFKVLEMWTYVEIPKVLEYIDESHSRGSKKCSLDLTSCKVSADGLAENKSGQGLIDVVSIQFKGCREIYPVVVYKAFRNGRKATCANLVMPVIDALIAEGIKVSTIICDAPWRATLRCQLLHSGYLACDYCLAVGTSVGGTVRYPVSTMKALVRKMQDLEHLRDHPHILATTSKKPHIRDQRLGYTELTPLMDLYYEQPTFSVITDVVVDYMHCICAGVTKSLLKRTFYENHKNNQYQAAAGIAISSKVNAALNGSALPTEFPRTGIGIHTGQFTTSEYRTTLLVYWHTIARVVHEYTVGRSCPSAKHLRVNQKRLPMLWTSLAFLFRAYMADEETYERLKEKYKLWTLRKEAYERWVNAYNTQGTTYNLHIFLSHADLMRKPGLMTDNSAFSFERMYGELRNHIFSGTSSTGLQALANHYLSRLQLRCEPRKLTITTFFKEGATHRDNLIVTTTGSFYQLKGKKSVANRETVYWGEKAKTRPYNPPWIPPGIDNFDMLGVRFFDGFEKGLTKIASSHIDTKAVIVDGVIFKIDRHILLEVI